MNFGNTFLNWIYEAYVPDESYSVEWQPTSYRINCHISYY